jgi:hypothetical protein
VGSTGALFALFVGGYLLGVWTACVVLRQGQDDYEDGSPGGAGHVIETSVVEVQR